VTDLDEYPGVDAFAMLEAMTSDILLNVWSPLIALLKADEMVILCPACRVHED